jgi:hypothetical protein
MRWSPRPETKLSAAVQPPDISSMRDGCENDERGGGGGELQTQGEGAGVAGVAEKMIGSGREIPEKSLVW